MFVIFDEMEDRDVDRLIRLTSGISDPSDYFSGLRRREEAAPDNVLVFVRRHPTDLEGISLRPDFHHRWLLIVSLSGMGTLQVDGCARRLSPGDALLLPPLQLHEYRKISADIHWVFITFDWHTGSASGGGPAKMDAVCGRRLQAVLENFLSPDPDGAITAVHLLELLRRLYPVTESGPPSGESWIARVQSVVGKHPTAGLQDVAQRLHVSESHLRACFRRETGMSLGKYLREARLRQAALWIRDEGLNVTEAAERAGYPDIFTFSRIFRRVLGRPPSRLRTRGSGTAD